MIHKHLINSSVNRVKLSTSLCDMVRICYWTRKALYREGTCYKELFYGLESHRCMEMSPVPQACTLRCIFCWRNCDNFSPLPGRYSLIPVQEYIQKLIYVRRQLLCGFGSNPLVDPLVFYEAMEPTHCTISLSGEPTLYPDIGKLVQALDTAGFITLLVTNGTKPAVLANLPVLPTQLYLSLHAYSQESFARICRPNSHGMWEKVKETVSLLKSLKCRKVVRVTVIKGENFTAPLSYARLINIASPEFIEVKRYEHLGYSVNFLGPSAVPSMNDLRNFARVIAGYTGYLYKDEHERSGAILLCKNNYWTKHRFLG